MHNYLKLICKVMLFSTFFIHLSLLAVDNNNKSIFLDVLLKEMHLRSKDYLGKESGEIQNGVLNVNAIELKKITPINNLYFQGEIMAPEPETIISTKAGKVVYVLGKNNYVFGTLYDENNTPVVKGTMVAALDKKDIDIQIDAAKKRKKIAKMAYDFIAKMTKAHESLSKYKMITSFELEQKKLDLMTGLMEYEATTRELDETLLTYKDPFIFTEESGVIVKSLVEPGQFITEGQPIVELLKMTPIDIKFKFPTKLIDSNIDKVKAHVYPQGSFIPITTTTITQSDDADHLYLHLSNKLHSSMPLTTIQTKMKKVFSIYSVRNMLGSDVEYYFVNEYLNRNKKILGVPIESIRKDKKGTFVLKAKGININKNKDIPKNLITEKVYIEVSNILENITYDINNVRLTRSIKKNDKIKLGDIIYGNCDPNIKNGEQVFRIPPNWIFFPEEIVKVRIPSFIKKGIYVPRDAIIHSGKSGNYVYLIENEMLKLTKVYVAGAYNNYCMILSNTLRDGQQVVIIDNEDLYNYLYDGRQVNVIKTEEPPIFLSRPHASDISQPNSSQFKNYELEDAVNTPKDFKVFNKYFGSKYNIKKNDIRKLKFKK
ncbi:MAG TPA: hypothetical protein QF753_06420 [Victivallales bacterium]|nr:hypothetical protein [Victivallales bacterium]